MIRSTMWMRIAGAALSGLLVAASLPPHDFGPLAWLAMLPILAALWTTPVRRAGWAGFWLGWLGGAL
ncbi:MAG: hypothetical protein ACO3RV_09030, partial [Luteolibacter sp.]